MGGTSQPGFWFEPEVTVKPQRLDIAFVDVSRDAINAAHLEGIDKRQPEVGSIEVIGTGAYGDMGPCVVRGDPLKRDRSDDLIIGKHPYSNHAFVLVNPLD